MLVAVIPARGGSKRIPRKNIRDFAGKPMIAHSIECALRCRLFERVLVSTDDDEIASVAKAHGAEVPFRRPKELADDHTGTTEVVAHAVEWLEAHAARPAEVCCIYATAPFVRASDLERGLATLREGRWTYVFSATTFAFPIFRSFEKLDGGALRMFFPQHQATRSQDLPEAIHDAGQFYWGTAEAWKARERVFGASSTVVMIDRWRVQDVDTVEDWQRCEILWEVLRKLEGRA